MILPVSEHALDLLCQTGELKVIHSVAKDAELAYSTKLMKVHHMILQGQVYPESKCLKQGQPVEQPLPKLLPLLLLLLDFLKLQSGFESREKRDLLVLLLQPW
ncbi:hypothetical protein V8G54_020801 [Vigna mungo]|uniref:Uncharacterized protein n=1 Tax=Vigna mungo TaxID=3915 RepID=A0AAQ3NCA3_VIGMU